MRKLLFFAELSRIFLPYPFNPYMYTRELLSLRAGSANITFSSTTSKEEEGGKGRKNIYA
jgi:hypothetical protein